MNDNSKIISIILAGLVLLPGCMRVPSYKPKSLQSISSDFMYRGVEKGIVVQAKCLTIDEVQSLFGQQGESFIPIYLSIHNLSNSAYILSNSEIDCAKMSHQEVSQLMKTSSIARLAGSVVAYGTTFGGIHIGVFGAFIMKSAIAMCGGFALAALSIGFGLTSIGTGIKSMIMNTRIRKDLQEKMIAQDTVIESGDKYEGLIFVKTEDYQSDFTVTLLEKNNQSNKIVFDVDLSSAGI